MDRETLEVDVLFVGAGVAALSGAIALKRKLKAAGKDASVLVLEQGEEIGHPQLSGAVLDPRALKELEPDFAAKGFPSQGEVKDDELRFFTSKSALPLRGLLLPPPFRNHGNLIVSLNQVVRWMKDLAEKEGVDVYPGFAADSRLEENGRVVGVRMKDVGVAKDGTHKPTFSPGMDVRAKVTVFAEGTRGSLTKKLVQQRALQSGKNPMTYGTGLKEIWETKHDLAGKVIHTAGYPLLEGGQYGGGWIYGLPSKQVSIGFVVGSNYGGPRFGRLSGL